MSHDEKNPRFPTPNDDGRLRPNPAPGLSLVEDMGGLVDDLRQMYTDFGLRPYRVFAVTYRWSGGAIGHGEACVEKTVEFLPTPELSVGSVRTEARTAGTVERGAIRLRGVSPRYTEDEIRNLAGCAGCTDVGCQVFIEVVMDARDSTTKRRRFTVRGVPDRRADNFDWEVSLDRQDNDRQRDGSPPYPARTWGG